ncbi:hypothetical protein [Anaerospora sp.]|jgi:hypothetical protein|uniref:hypothetical protein n=1 Tax=Anaerospora sp. TaxID=1960278 RepID=UPI00289FC83B|nr:hypothetical protein [Anaerospora sp.]
MKKQVVLMTLCLLLLAGIPVQAEETAKTSPMDWEISILPKPTQEDLEKQRWSPVFSNDIGIYTFDNKSLVFDETDKNLVHVFTKTTFVDKKIIKSLNEKYKEQLNAGDKVLCSEMEMVFHIKQKTYAVIGTKVWSEQGISLEDKKQTGKFAPVTPNTFADTMYDIARNFARNG